MGLRREEGVYSRHCVGSIAASREALAESPIVVTTVVDVHSADSAPCIDIQPADRHVGCLQRHCRETECHHGRYSLLSAFAGVNVPGMALTVLGVMGQHFAFEVRLL